MNNVLMTDDNGHQVYTFSITSESAGPDKSHKKNGTYATPQAARPRDRGQRLGSELVLEAFPFVGTEAL